MAVTSLLPESNHRFAHFLLTRS